MLCGVASQKTGIIMHVAGRIIFVELDVTNFNCRM